MAKVVGPWSPNFPVNFVSNGDPTRAAFGKHIQEIERIYGLLSGLGAAKIEAEDLNEALENYVPKTDFNDHVNSANPHPNLQLATLGGSLGFDRISGSLGLDRTTGNLDLSRTTGNLPSSRVSGNFDTSRINGLEELISSSAGGTLEIHDNGDSGYIRFSNGFIVQWVDAPSVDGNYNITFPIPFPNKCIGGTVGYTKDNYSKTEYHSGGTSSKYRYTFFGY